MITIKVSMNMLIQNERYSNFWGVTLTPLINRHHQSRVDIIDYYSNPQKKMQNRSIFLGLTVMWYTKPFQVSMVFDTISSRIGDGFWALYPLGAFNHQKLWYDPEILPNH